MTEHDDESHLQEILHRRNVLREEIQDIEQEISELNELIEENETGKKDAAKSVERLRLRGLKLFNQSAEKGIELLVETGILQRTPECIAKFFMEPQQISRLQIGEFIGTDKKFNNEVRALFVGHHSFASISFVAALRQFLTSFRLPGEGQKIERLMLAFAQRYREENPTMFTSDDACWVVAVSVIMLNTSLHNRNVPKNERLDVVKFANILKGVNGQKDFPNEFLQQIYEDIKQQELTPVDDSDVSCAFFNPDKEGWLEMLGRRRRMWKRRWFVLKDSQLCYFRYTTDEAWTALIPLENLRVQACALPRHPYCVMLTSEDDGFVKACKMNHARKQELGHHLEYVLSANSQQMRDEWLKAIQAKITKNPLLNILLFRRQRAKQKGARQATLNRAQIVESK